MKNLDNLNHEDLLYMICNKSNFSLPIISLINFNNEKWMEAISKNLSIETVDHIRNNSKKVKELCRSIYDSLKELNDKSPLCILFDKINHLKFETNENIYYVIKYFNNCCIETFHNKDVTSQYHLLIKNIICTFYTKILPWKMKTNAIYKKINTIKFGYDDTLSKICNDSTSYYILSSIVSDNHTPNYIAYNIYLLYKLFVQDTNDIDNDFIEDICKISSIVNMSSEFYDEVKDQVYKKLKTCDDYSFPLDISDDYTSDDNVNEYLDRFNKQATIEDYTYHEEKINAVLNDKTIIVGDNVLSENLSPNRVLTEIKILEDDIERNYTDMKDYLDNRLSFKELVYMKLNKLPLCKVVLSNGDKYNLTKIDESTFCLFRSLDGVKLIGFSIPSKFGDKRLYFNMDIAEK